MKRHSYLLAAAVTLVVAACSNNDKDRDPPPPMANQAPTVSAITAKAASQDTVVGPIDFTVGDDVTPLNQVTVTATADGTGVFAADGLVITGTGATRTLTLTPLEAATGVANITLTAIDAEGLTATSSFAVTVSSNPASVREVTLSTFAKGELADATPVNGFTFTQDADDPAVFDSLIGPE